MAAILRSLTRDVTDIEKKNLRSVECLSFCNCAEPCFVYCWSTVKCGSKIVVLYR